MRLLLSAGLSCAAISLTACSDSASPQPSGNEPCIPGTEGCSSRCPVGQVCRDDGSPPFVVSTNGRDVTVLPTPDAAITDFEDIAMQRGDDRLTLRSPVVVTGMVRGGQGTDTLIWEGARLSDDSGTLLDISRILEFEILHFRPAVVRASLTAEIDAAELPALFANNPDAEAITVGFGASLTGGRVDWPNGVSLRFENGVLDAQVRFGDEQDTVHVLTTSRILQTAALDGGGGEDTIFWDGSGAIEGSITGWEHLTLPAMDVASLRQVPITVLPSLLDTRQPNEIQVSSGYALTGDALLTPAGSATGDTDADAVRISAGSSLTGSINMGAGNDVFELLERQNTDRSRMEGSVQMGAGEDTFFARAGSVVRGTWEGGIGNDTFRAERFSFILDENGDLPSLSGGEGTDRFIWDSAFLGESLAALTMSLHPNAQGQWDFEDVVIALTPPARFSDRISVSFALHDLQKLFDRDQANRLEIDLISARKLRDGSNLAYPVDAEDSGTLDLGDRDDELVIRDTVLPADVCVIVDGGAGMDTLTLDSFEALGEATEGCRIQFEGFETINMHHRRFCGIRAACGIEFLGVEAVNLRDTASCSTPPCGFRFEKGTVILRGVVLAVGRIEGSDQGETMEIADSTIGRSFSGSAAAIDLGGGDDTFELTGGTLELTGILRGGSGNDKFNVRSDFVFSSGGVIDGGDDHDILCTPSAADLERLMESRVRVENIEDTSCWLAPQQQIVRVLSSELLAESLRPAGEFFGAEDGYVSFYVGDTEASYLWTEGGIADGLNLLIDRDYSPLTTDLSVAHALSIGKPMRQFHTDRTAGWRCRSSARTLCDLLLYDRAVPAALALTATLQNSADSPTDSLEPVQHTSFSTRLLRQDSTGSGSVQWPLQSLAQARNQLSGLQTQWDHRAGDFSLRAAVQALHMDWNVGITDMHGPHRLAGRLTGLLTRLSVLWTIPADIGSFAVVTDAGYFSDDSLQSYHRPVQAELSARQQRLWLGYSHNLLHGRTARISAYAAAERNGSDLRLQGLDQLDVRASGDNRWRSSVGLTGAASRTGGGRLHWDWAAVWRQGQTPLKAQVLNTRSADVLRWDTTGEVLQWRLQGSLPLGSGSRLSLRAERTDWLDSPQWQAHKRDYQAILSLQSAF